MSYHGHYLESSEDPQKYPPFCPIHKLPDGFKSNVLKLALAKLNCNRFQSCSDCRAEHIDVNVDPPHSPKKIDPGG